MIKAATFKEVFPDLFKFLTFRAKWEDYERFGTPHFCVGLIFTWLVGIARNWDFADSPFFAKMGLGSVIYIFVLAAILLVATYAPAEGEHGYRKYLTVVAMTSVPGLIYGVPVEMFMTIEGAQSANLVFLAIVALWRVSLFIHFLVQACTMSVFTAILTLLTPIAAIIIGLVMTGRIEFLIDIMGGIRQASDTKNQAVALFINNAFCLSWPILGLGLIIHTLAFAKWVQDNREARADQRIWGKGEDES